MAASFADTLAVISIGPYDLNGFDAAVLLLLVISGLYAFARGFVREVTSILALAVSAVSTLYLFGRFRFAVREMLSPPELADGVLILGAGLGTYFVAALLLSKVGKSLSGERPGFLDRLLGAGFGIARGLLIAALFVMFWSADYRSSLETADFSDYLRENADRLPPDVLDRLPQSMRDQLDAGPAELPELFRDSAFYPLLDRIGDAIRALPFTDMRSYAERIKDGDLQGLTLGGTAEEIRP
ncbi:MAG: CvpA family protein [Litorimonas sp.]